MKRVYVWLICAGVLMGLALGGCSMTAAEPAETTGTTEAKTERQLEIAEEQRRREESELKTNVYVDLPAQGIAHGRLIKLEEFPHTDAAGEARTGALYVVTGFENKENPIAETALVVDPGDEEAPWAMQTVEGSLQKLHLADLDGDGYPEIILDIHSGTGGGWGEVYRYVPGADTLEVITLPRDTGFEGEFVYGDETVTLTNTYTGKTVTVKASDPIHPEPGDWQYGRTTGPNFSEWRDTQPVDADGDGVYELVTLFGETHYEAAGVGYASTLLKYDKASGEMKVQKAGILTYQQVEGEDGSFSDESYKTLPMYGAWWNK